MARKSFGRNNQNDTVEKHETQKEVIKSRQIFSRKFTIVFVGLFFVLAVAIFGLFNLLSKDSNTTSEFSLGSLVSQEILDASSLQNDNRTIQSSFGFSLSYDTKMFDVQGQVTDPASDANYISGMTYTEDELDTEREYSLIKLRSHNAETIRQNAEDSFVNLPELVFLTNIRQDFWDSRINDPALAGKSKLQIYIDEVMAESAEGYEISLSEPEVITLNGVEFTKIVKTRIANSYGLDNKYQDVYYFAVHNDRPYQIVIYDIQNDTNSIVAQMEGVVSTFTLGDVDTTKLSYLNSSDVNSSVLSAETSQSTPKDSANLVNEIDEDNILDVVVRNQLAVVRVGSILCMDIDLVGYDSSTTIEGVCTVYIGSGSIISTDGLVATNGHVIATDNMTIISDYLANSMSVDVLANKAEAFMPYFIAIGDVSPSQAQAFITAIRSGEQDAVNLALSLANLIHTEDINVTATNNIYALQLSNEPLKLVDITELPKGFQDSDGIASAKLIDKDFDVNTPMNEIQFADLKGSDVALLKMDGSNFPAVRLGSILGIDLGDKITAIGYPAFVDGGLMTAKAKTVPSVSQGQLLRVMQQSLDSNMLLLTDVPISGGNSGGPAFDSTGNQIGLNTYSKMDCEDSKCFGNGTARDIEDIRVLLKRNSLQLSTAGTVNEDWNQAVDAFKSGNYKLATAKFASVKSNYANHYLAAGMYDIANSLNDSAIVSAVPTTTTNKALLSIILATLIVGVICLVYFLLRKNGYKLAHVHAMTPVGGSLPSDVQASASQPSVASPNPSVGVQSTQPMTAVNSPIQPPVQPVSTQPLVSENQIPDQNQVAQPAVSQAQVQPTNSPNQSYSNDDNPNN
ncbi:trypsin-like peptidase domain-containing protein [Candidatus Saccharibacteria bacterium]|nr:trypsin-like peptidase domain-containing protein [Candidatus Saccharibacteria bacterium]